MAKYTKTRKYDSDIHVFEFNPRENPSQLSFGKKGKTESLSDINHKWFDDNGYKAVAKVNMGFFWNDHEHLGMVMHDGGFIEGSPSSTNGVECYLDDEYKFHVGQIEKSEVDNIAESGFKWGGSLSYSLIVNGEKSFINSDKYYHFNSRNPRTLIGQKKDGNMLLVVADGRSSKSRGLTGKQSASVMLEFGCINAINADGGGSSTMIVNDEVVNNPSDGSERNIGTALLVFEKEEVGQEPTNTELNIVKDYLTPNKYSRPQRDIDVKGIVWHWVANPNTSAKANRNYFESRKNGDRGYGSAHYIIDLDGSIIQCLPDNEMGYHVGSRTYTNEALNRLGSYPNGTTIGIECTHTDWEGNMTDETWQSLVELTAQLLNKYNLDVNDIWLHKTVVGWKDCHKLFTNNPELYKDAKDDVESVLNKGIEAKIVNPKEFANDITVVDVDAEGMYTVNKGDTFWSIAQAFNMSTDELENLNPNTDPNNLVVGKRILIQEMTITDHVVKKGDTVWSIANKYDTTVDKLRQLNKGLEAKTLQIGGRVIVGVDKSKDIKPKEESVTDDLMLGRVKGAVWLHDKPNLDAYSRTRVLNTGESCKIYGEKEGMYDVGVGYVSKKYVEVIGKVNRIDLPSVVLRRGDTGSNVVQLQRALNKVNFIVGKEDGDFGARTENALKRFQSVYTPHGVDGVYGSKTEKALEEQLNK